MIKQLIMPAMPLLIHNAPEAIEYAQIIFNFIILAQYVLHNDKTFHYIAHILYKLENRKIVFEYHQSINSKLYKPIFNYLKFYAISHFIQCIWDYNCTINYNSTHSEAAHKYFLKTFYNKTNKIEHNLQI